MSRMRGALLGLACGDAVGTTVEFMPRGSFPRVSDMIGRGPFGLAPGEWTDDTSMALCLAESLIAHGGFDARDQAERYLRWWREGYMSHTGRCFDIGNTVRSALSAFAASNEPMSGPAGERDAGNGSIMRLAPVPIFFFPDADAAIEHAAESSRTTHGARECIDACRLLAALIVRALGGATKEEILDSRGLPTDLAPKIAAIAAAGYRASSEDEVHGTGYVVQSLEAALWCFAQGEDFEEAILRAANLGDDADTTAAICGQIAGAHWGASGIPERWLAKLAWRDRITGMADALRSTRLEASQWP